MSNELDKISSYLLKKEKISLEEVVKLTNLYEDYSVSELADNCLAKNLKKTIKIINENNFNIDDSVLIIRTLLAKTKRILDIKKHQNENKSIDQIISTYKPTIFWKDKEIVKSQVAKWKLTDVENLIEKIYNLELNVKKNYQSSKYIISDFILYTAS